MDANMKKIAEIEEEINRTQKNKATEHHLAMLKAKLSILRKEVLAEGSRKGGAGGPTFEVAKSGTARVGLVGFPSVGKSTLLNALTDAESEVADYEFTTLKPIPGMYTHNGAHIQVLDLPGIIEGAKDGRGKGRAVIAAARTSDLLLICLDGTKPLPMKRKIEYELEGFGIRLNRVRRDVTVKRKLDGGMGGISFRTTCKELTGVTEDEAKAALKEMKIHSAEILIRDPDTTIEDIIDAASDKAVIYMPALYIVNKIDALTIEELDLFDMLPNWIPISAHHGWNMEELKEAIWDKLGLMRIYTKPRGEPIDYEEPVIIKTRKEKPTVETLCYKIHRDLATKFKHAFVWGTSVKYPGQRVGKGHVLCDEDVITIISD